MSRLLLLGVSGCVGAGPGSAQPLSLALGATTTLDPDALCPSCADEVDEIRDVVVEVPGVLEIVDIGPARITVRGAAEGDSLLTISGLDDGVDVVERYAEVTVSPVHTLAFSPRCDPYEPADDPYLLPAGSELTAFWFLYDTDFVSLEGDPEFDLGMLGARSVDVERKSLVIEAPDTLGTSEITSPLWDAVVATIEVFDPSAYDGIAFHDPFALTVELDDDPATLVRTAMLVGGERTCVDEVERLAETLTPTICGVGGDADTATSAGSLLTVTGRAVGTCTVRVSAPAYGFSAETDVAVVPAP